MARDPKYDCLFEPIRIGPKTMRNRFYQVPHCNGAGVEFMGANAAFRGVKAEGGWGGVCTEAITIDPETDTQPMKLCNIWDDGDVQNLRHLTDAIHAWDSLAGAELAHGGVPSLNLNSRGVARTATEAGSAWTLATYTHEADLDDIREVQELFVDAAKRAIQAGFDIVYIYGSHSVLPMQFLSPQYNKRQTELKADSVVLVTGRTANSGLYKDLRTRKDEWEKNGVQAVYQAGDCYAPRFISEAVFDGHRIAREFESENPQRPLPYIRERVLWSEGTKDALIKAARRDV